MKPIGTPAQAHYAAALRCIARSNYRQDIGGVRTQEERRIVLNLIEAERRRAKPRFKLAA